MTPHELTHAIARAFGLPAKTTRAVITLEVGELPKIEVECYETPLRIVQSPEGIDSLAMLHFMLRLEPFPTTTEDVTP